MDEMEYLVDLAATALSLCTVYGEVVVANGSIRIPHSHLGMQKHIWAAEDLPGLSHPREPFIFLALSHEIGLVTRPRFIPRTARRGAEIQHAWQCCKTSAERWESAVTAVESGLLTTPQ